MESAFIAGERRVFGLTETSQSSTLPMYAAAGGPMFETQEINEAITDAFWVRAAEVFGDLWIKDQNGRGACAGYAAASALERARARRGLEFVELSGDAIYAAVNRGVDQGSGLENNMVWLRDNGIPPASMVPRHEYRKNRIPAAAYESGKRFRGFETFAIRTEIEMASALVAGFSVVIACHAGNGGRAPDGLIDWTNGVGNHSVVCDDIRLRNNTWEYQIANSWGLHWGERGRGWLRWKNHLSNPVRNHMFYAIRSTKDDPEGDNPPPPKEES
jgi:hypothetical protein